MPALLNGEGLDPKESFCSAVLVSTLSLDLLQERAAERRRRRLQVREEVRRRLRAALAHLIPGEKVIVFGSLVRAGVFNDRSDVDLALEREPRQMSDYQLASRLMEMLQRPVDVVLLQKSRLREKILREGEVWTV